LVRANATGSDYSVVLVVYRGTRGALQQVACSGGNDVRFGASAGETYFILAGSFLGSPSGRLILTLQAKPKLNISVSVDEVGSADSEIGAGTIRGTVRSSRPVIISLYGTLRQTVGRVHVISGDFGMNRQLLVPSTGQASWRAMVFSDDGAFGGGFAFASVNAAAYDQDDFANAEASSTVHLKGSDQIKLEPAQARILRLEGIPDGSMRVWSDLILGQTNILQTSSNLRDWAPVSTNLPLNSPFPWLDPRSATLPEKFYRVVTMP
jgi:hypothetical protein